MKKLYYIFIAFLIIVVGVEFRVCEEDILMKLLEMIENLERDKELIL